MIIFGLLLIVLGLWFFTVGWGILFDGDSPIAASLFLIAGFVSTYAGTTMVLP